MGRTMNRYTHLHTGERGECEYTEHMRDKYIFIIAGVVAIVIGALLFLSGVDVPSSPVATNYDNTTATATAVPFTKVVQGEKSIISRRANFLITSPEQVKELWKLIDATTTPPQIDFSTHSLVAVFAGQEPSSSIQIAKIEDTDARTVSIAIAKPEDACIKEALTSSPYEIVIVSTTSLKFTHKDIPTTVSCAN